MTKTLTQHIPGFVDGASAKTATGTIEELCEVPWVKEYSTAFGRTFDRFEVRGDLLVAVFDAGDWWWVVGYLRDATP